MNKIENKTENKTGNRTGKKIRIDGKSDHRTMLIAPAGSWESLSAAIDSGADAVYFGSKLLNMRANAKNFEITELKKLVSRCHESNVKAFLTLNTIIFDDETAILDRILDAAKEARVDGIITWDLSVITRAKKIGIPFQISTQASVSNFDALRFYHDLGAECVVLARETSLERIKAMRDRCAKENINIRIEAFCHGAMCVAFSGRCFMSQFLYGRSANRGDCLQPCRRAYNISDPETGKELQIENHYVLSPKDLCTIPIIDKLIESGIDVLKIEGRNRPPEYVKAVTVAYRTAIDAYYAGNLTEKLKEDLVEKLKQVYNRKFHTGFYLGTPTADDFTDLYGSDSPKQKIFIGTVKKVYQKINVFEIEINSEELRTGDNILITGKTTGVAEAKIICIHDYCEKEVDIAKKGMHVGIKLDKDIKLRVNDKIFRFR